MQPYSQHGHKALLGVTMFIVLSSSSDISSNIPMDFHLLATLLYSSFINCCIVGFDIPAEQSTTEKLLCVKTDLYTKLQVTTQT